MSAYQLLDL